LDREGDKISSMSDVGSGVRSWKTYGGLGSSNGLSGPRLGATGRLKRLMGSMASA
jgi:hypothetical protein